MMLEQEILSDASQSDWLRCALRAAIACDPVRAANDAEVLACILRDRAARLAQADEAMSIAAQQNKRSTVSLSIELPQTRCLAGT